MSTSKSSSLTLRAALVAALASAGGAQAAENPFAMTELPGGFMVAEEAGKCGNICGGGAPKFSDKGEMVKCGSQCGEVAKCGNICGGQAALSAANMQPSDGKDHEVAKCGNICAAAGH
ncbi:MAG: hypothetical protein AB7O21_01800 [Gammaproteobacteria bacterium]